MGDLCNRRSTNVLAGIGFLLLLLIGAYTALVVIPQKVQKYRLQQQLHNGNKAVSASCGAAANQGIVGGPFL